MQSVRLEFVNVHLFTISQCSTPHYAVSISTCLVHTFYGQSVYQHRRQRQFAVTKDGFSVCLTFFLSPLFFRLSLFFRFFFFRSLFSFLPLILSLFFLFCSPLFLSLFFSLLLLFFFLLCFFICLFYFFSPFFLYISLLFLHFPSHFAVVFPMKAHRQHLQLSTKRGL